MFKEYIYLLNLSQSQIEGVKNFNNNPYIEFENLINCEICNSKKISVLFNNDCYGLKQKTCVCNNCGFMFSNPRLTQKSAEFFYSSDLYRLIYDKSSTNLNNQSIFSNAVKQMKYHKPSIPKKPDFNIHYQNLYFDFINYHIQDFKTVLDIGCGKGVHLVDFNSLGKKTFGIEPSKTFQKVHSQFGLNTKIGYIKDVEDKFDLVILKHVFEHLTELKKNVNHLYNITNKYLFIEVPGHINKLPSIQNAHNYYFSINTLNYFFLKNKFKIIKIDYARDNEFIYALYQKTTMQNTELIFDNTLEVKNVRKIIRKYFFKYIFLKILRILKIEKNIRELLFKFNQIFKLT